MGQSLQSEHKKGIIRPSPSILLFPKEIPMFWRRHDLPRLIRRLNSDTEIIERFLPYLPGEYGQGAFDPRLPVRLQDLGHPLSGLIENWELRAKLQAYGEIHSATASSLNALRIHHAKKREQWVRIGGIHDTLCEALRSAEPQMLPGLFRSTSTRLHMLVHGPAD